MCHRQFRIRALIMAALIGAVFGQAVLQGAWRPLDLRVDVSSARLLLATSTVQAAKEKSCSQIIFAEPKKMTITWDVTAPGTFDSEPLTVPGRYNFPCGAIYRLRLTDIPGHDGVEIYPTNEIAPPLPRTQQYLDANAIPVSFTEADFADILQGRFVTKVIYLPERELGLPPGVETIVNRLLEQGMDPIVEADRRGAILAIIRIGNRDVLTK